MRRRLPGLSVGLAAMFAVIAYRAVRGLSDPIRRGGRAKGADFQPSCKDNPRGMKKIFGGAALQRIAARESGRPSFPLRGAISGPACHDFRQISIRHESCYLEIWAHEDGKTTKA
jgi:hypothetical protein